MKIAFVRHSILNRGGDRVILEYAGYLAQRGHEIAIWASHIDTVFSMPLEVKINRIGRGSKFSTVISCILAKFPSDIVVADIIAMASLLSLRNCRRVVYFAQDYDESYYSSWFMKAITRIFYLYALRVKKIPTIAVSSSLAGLLSRRFKIKADVVPNGVDFTKFYPDIDKEILSKKDGKKAVLIFARSDYRKGLDVALAALKNLSGAGAGKDMVVWVIGGGLKDMPGLEVKNFGFVNEDILRKILSAADVLLLPSRHEGFGLMVLEAMACGCAILTSDAVSIVRDNEDALVVPVGNVSGLTEKLILLLQDDDLRGRLRNQGYMTVKRYDLNNSKQEFEKALLSLGVKDA